MTSEVKIPDPLDLDRECSLINALRRESQPDCES